MVMDKEAWHAAVHGVTKSRTRLSNWTDWTDQSDTCGVLSTRNKLGYNKRYGNYTLGKIILINARYWAQLQLSEKTSSETCPHSHVIKSGFEPWAGRTQCTDLIHNFFLEGWVYLQRDIERHSKKKKNDLSSFSLVKLTLWFYFRSHPPPVRMAMTLPLFIPIRLP